MTFPNHSTRNAPIDRPADTFPHSANIVQSAAEIRQTPHPLALIVTAMDSDYSPPPHTQPLQLPQSLAMAATITEADRSDLIEMLHELAERRRADARD